MSAKERREIEFISGLYTQARKRLSRHPSWYKLVPRDKRMLEFTVSVSYDLILDSPEVAVKVASDHIARQVQRSVAYARQVRDFNAVTYGAKEFRMDMKDVK